MQRAFKINTLQNLEQINVLINYGGLRDLGKKKVIEDNEFLENFQIKFVFIEVSINCLLSRGQMRGRGINKAA